MKRTILIVMMGLACWTPAGLGQAKRRVAVMNFDYATVQSSAAAIFGNNLDVGKGIADILVDKLVTAGTYSVIERKAIDKILAEQNFSNSDRADPASAAKIGKLLGVDAIVIGSITQFGRDDRTTNIGGGALGGVTGRFGLGGVGRKQAKAVVGISARLVSTDTGEILAVASGKGESTRSGASLLGAGGSSGGSGGGAVDMNSTNFADTVLGEAVGAAVTQLSAQLNQSSAKIVAKTVVVDGLVADVSGNQIVLNVGSKAGVKIGDRLQVKRTGREIRDPASGKVIRRMEQTLGEVTVTEVDEVSSVGVYSGPGAVKVGDAVRTIAQ
ncbi:MAG TPA: curli production assembly protein CsgG [Solibacterales bacterium]|nr:curli production assembly protein CsgG [Bryobacterales bacterium]